LIEDKINTIHQLILLQEDSEYLNSIFKYGFEGYVNFSKIELENEAYEQFDKIYIIKE
jgi:hypothetical protein